jgi:hypothetical protein
MFVRLTGHRLLMDRFQHELIGLNQSKGRKQRSFFNVLRKKETIYKRFKKIFLL